MPELKIYQILKLIYYKKLQEWGQMTLMEIVLVLT